jgi:hypothetical protein
MAEKPDVEVPAFSILYEGELGILLVGPARERWAGEIPAK